MKNLTRFLFVAGLLVTVMSQDAHAQDKIIFRFKPDTINIKVIEIGVDEIKYKLWPVDENAAMIVERKDKIRRIIFENGTVMKFYEDEFSDPANYTEQRKMVVKIDPFAILIQTTSLSFEQSLKPGRSREVGLGIIGLGARIDETMSAGGAFVRFGYKFLSQPDYKVKGMYYRHILKGGYIKPELTAVWHQITYANTYHDYSNPNMVLAITHKDKYNYQGLAFMLNFGKQYVFDDIFAVDIFMGFGVGKKSATTLAKGADIGTPSSGNSLSNLEIRGSGSPYGFNCTSENNIGFCMQAGLKVGILIGTNKHGN